MKVILFVKRDLQLVALTKSHTSSVLSFNSKEMDVTRVWMVSARVKIYSYRKV